MKIKTTIFRSTQYDPWYNLALEEHLLKNVVEEDQVILYLWQNQHTVVIGRNQNAWKQCRCKELEDSGGKLARRLSGGGAVYHDLGNMNFTFLMHRRHYNLERQLEVLLQAVKKEGIDARFSGRNDLVADGRKFSGNAFYFEENRCYHHGTLLVDVNFDDMTKYLQVSSAKMRSKAVESVKARVVNLRELSPALTIESMADSVASAFIAVYGGEKEVNNVDPSSMDLEDGYNHYASWDWRYGKTPNFDVEFSNRFDWGEIDMGLSLQKAHITEAVIWSDAMNPQLIEQMASCLSGMPLQADTVASRLAGLAQDEKDREVVDQFTAWFKEQLEEL